MKPLITLNKELVTGLHPGLAYDDVPFWKTGANVVFRRDYCAPLIPHFALGVKLSSEVVRGMFECRLAGVPTVFFGTVSKLFKWTKAAGIEDVSRAFGYGGNSQTLWSFSQWGNWVFATNGTNAPQVFMPPATVFANWDPDNSGGFTWTTAEINLPYKSFLLALNTTNAHGTPKSGGSDFIHWSESDDPFSWDPTDINNAECGDLPIRDAEGPIRAAILYRRVLFFFTDHSGHVLNFIGAPEYFGSQRVLGAGAVGKQAIDEYQNLLYVFGMNNIWRTDGTQVQIIDEPSVHEYVYGELNHDQRSMALVWANPFDGIVEFHFPVGSSQYNNRAVGFNPENNTWTILERVRSSAARVNTLSFGITGTFNGDVLGMRTGEYLSTNRGAPSIGAPFAMNESHGQNFGYGYLGHGEGGYGGTSS